MKQTRREFLVTSAVAAAGVGLARPAEPAEPAMRHEMFDGDLYVAERGLGGRSFEEARDYAMKFRDMEI